MPSRSLSPFVIACLASALCLMISLESTCIKWVKLNEQVSPHSEHLIILSEIIKGLVCLTIYNFNKYYKTRTTPNEESLPLFQHPNRNLEVGWNSMWTLAVPALIYTLSNNVTYAALSVLSSSMFSLLMNLKIPMTGVLARFILRKRISFMGWGALLTLFFGSAIACIKTGKETWITWAGFVLMMIYATCSASAAVYMEHITRYAYSHESLMWQNVKFSVWGIVFNLCVSIYRQTLFSWSLQWIHLLSVISMVLNGLMTSLVIKYAGSIVKTYAAAFAALVTSILAFVIWHQVLPWNYYVGASVCCFAIHMYAYDKQSRH